MNRPCDERWNIYINKGKFFNSNFFLIFSLSLSLHFIHLRRFSFFVLEKKKKALQTNPIWCCLSCFDVRMMSDFSLYTCTYSVFNWLQSVYECVSVVCYSHADFVRISSLCAVCSERLLDGVECSVWFWNLLNEKCLPLRHKTLIRDAKRCWLSVCVADARTACGAAVTPATYWKL